MGRNILFLVANFHLQGGGERVSTNLANYFAGVGDKVKIVSIAKAESSSLFPLHNNIELEYLNIELFNLIVFISRYCLLLIQLIEHFLF